MIIAQLLVAPAVSPPTIQRCRKILAIKIGTTAIKMPAASPVGPDHADSRPNLRILANMSSSKNRTSTDSTTRMGCPEPGR